ncbi:F-box/LRR-repeat protein [Camellia lanceoleosa]|uniref:F-box/LRR-repeat protein n=1 Tax=Camellia lanceoleosa TaxID=1840588 RepID=A0ACC0GUV7_9ERIC|nr:F-box/LRR-repeat protein [Camellia lanceoleosa]
MGNWKYLEFLRFGTTFKMEEILAQISIHCKNFAGFSAFHADIKKDEATSIVTSVPNIEYLGLRCPNLRTFVLPYGLPYEHMLKIPNLINKWKSLEYLTLGAICFQLQDIIYQISIHCNNFVGLGVPDAYIGKSDASAIATLLPNIKELDLRCANIEKEYLVMILKGCKELEYVNVSYCEGFDEGDIDILKLASHIHTFKPEGSMFYSDHDEEGDDNNDFDLDEMYYCGYRSC